MPEADGVTVGGAIDFTKRIEWSDLTANDTVDVVSSSVSDTAVKAQLLFRDPTGLLITSSVITLAGQTKVSMSATVADRIEAAVITGGSIAGLANPTGTAAVGDIAMLKHTLPITAHTMQAGSAQATTTVPAIAKLQAGDGATVAVGWVLRTTGGTGANQIRRILQINPGGLGADIVAIDRNWGTIPDATTTYETGPGIHFELAGSSQGVALTGTSTQVLAVTRRFATSQADIFGGSNRTFYEKWFVNNNNLTTALSSANIQIFSETGALPTGATLDLALDKALNDTATTSNRQTLPANGDTSALTFVIQPSAINVIAGNGQLPASAGAGNAAGAQGAWERLTLLAGTVPYKGFADIRTNGATI